MAFSPQIGLLVVAVCWGVSFPLIRVALQSVSAPKFVFVRFALAGLAFLFVLLIPKIRREIWRILLPGLGIGFLNYFIFTSQTLAMETISGPRAAFITGSYVVFVPLLSRAFGRPSPSRMDWVSVVFAFVGLAILANPFSSEESVAMRTGDLFALFCSLCVAVKIHTLTRLAVSGAGAVATAFLQVWGVVLLYVLTYPALPSTWFSGEWTGIALLCVASCAWGISVGTFYLQSTCQRAVPPHQSALIYCLEPVFATIFSFLMIGEQLTPNGFIGAAFILAAQILPYSLRKIPVTAHT
jgi:drug/metabolite transporter (DMT)-like permease